MRLRWLDIGQKFFSVPINIQKVGWPIFSLLDKTSLVNIGTIIIMAHRLPLVGNCCNPMICGQVPVHSAGFCLSCLFTELAV